MSVAKQQAIVELKTDLEALTEKYEILVFQIGSVKKRFLQGGMIEEITAVFQVKLDNGERTKVFME